MAVLEVIARELLRMATKQLPAIANRIRRLFPQRTPIDLHTIDGEDTFSRLTQPARVVLWHLCDGSKKPEVLARILRDARIDANIDRVLTELEAADLVAHDLPGLRFIKPEQLSLVRELCRRTRSA